MAVSVIDKNVIYGGPYKEPSGYSSIGDIIVNYLGEKEDEIILINGANDTKWSAGEILKASVRVAKALYLDGVRKDDIVSIVSENKFEFITIAFGTFMLNAVLAPLNPNYTERELKHGIALAKPKIIFASTTAIEKINSISNDFPSIKKIINIDSDDSFKILDSTMTNSFNIKTTVKIPIDKKNQTAVILLSSGTTGIPKGCEITQANLIACISAYERRIEFLRKFNERITIMNVTPWFHVMGLVNIFSGLLAKSCTVVNISRFEPKIFLNAIQKHKVMVTSIPPPVVVFLSKTPLVHDFDLTSLRAIFSGGAPLKQETEEVVKDIFKKKIVILQGYGMTETTAGIICSFAGVETPGSTGEVEEGMYTKIVDSKGQTLGPHKVGEVCCKGNRIMKGYLNDPKATAEVIDKNGWLHTGDLGYYDENKRVFIVDRLKELIKFKGFQVPPAELEGLLLSNPKIKDCGVIGIPDENAGELPFAFVVKQSEISEEEVKIFVKENASNAKWLRGGVKFINEIPKNLSGKILRRELRELYKSMKSKL